MKTSQAEPATLSLTFNVDAKELALMLRFDVIERSRDGYRLTKDGARTAAFALRALASDERQRACGYRPTWWSKSLIHRHHGQNGREYDFGYRYACAACDRQFSDAAAMARHIRSAHGIDPFDPYKPGVATRIKQRVAREAEARAAAKLAKAVRK